MLKQLCMALLAMTSAATVSGTNWASGLPDYMKVRQMSIPGAHDAAAKDLSGLSALLGGKTQDLSIEEQWDKGVRAFDLRPAYTSNTLMIYHGSASTNVTLQSAFETLESKLTDNPGEFAVVFVKHENDADDSSSEWSAKMSEFMISHDDMIATYSPAVTLGEIRGKILVFTRDAFISSKIPHADNWGDNELSHDGVVTYDGVSTISKIQDNYKVTDQSAKTSAITALLDYSCANNYAPSWVFNHTSGYSGTLGTNSNITKNADISNKVALDYLNDETKPSGRTGIVFMDYAGSQNHYGSELVDAIIARNYVDQSLSESDIVSFFNNKSNWQTGPAGTSIGTASTAGRTVVESYRDDKFAIGTVMYAECDGVADGDYIVSLMAHANWTPGRGSITSAKARDKGTGWSVMYINNSMVDLPVTHSTGFPSPLHEYDVPVRVENGIMRIAFENLREGANWFTCYVTNVTKVTADDDRFEPENFRYSHSNPVHWFASPTNWVRGEAFGDGNLQHKDNLFVETWRDSGVSPDGEVIYSTLENLADGKYLLGVYAFSCFTGTAREENGVTGFAALRANDTEVPLSTYNSGSVPTPHELFHIPVEVVDGRLKLSVVGYGYPNWFGVDVVSLTPADDKTDMELYVMEYMSQWYGHGFNSIVSQMSVGIQNNQVKSDNGVANSNGEPFHENWNGTPYTGRFVGAMYIPGGTYEVSLDCFASGIGDVLDSYYLFANESREPKKEANAFETLTTRVVLPAPAPEISGTRSAGQTMTKLYRLEYGFGIDQAATQWTAIKNPRIVKLKDSNIGTGVNSIGDDSVDEAVDMRVFNSLGICVGKDENAFGSLAPGIYIMNGRKYIIR